MTLYDQLEAATSKIRSQLGGRQPTVGMILGSGLGDYADSFSAAAVIDYASIPHFPISTVSGHAGKLIIGEREGVVCAAMKGRAHFYEGHSASRVAFGARCLVHLGKGSRIGPQCVGWQAGLINPFVQHQLRFQLFVIL